MNPLIAKVRKWQEDEPNAAFSLFAFACFFYLAWLTYRTAGVFLGSIRADESYFLQNSWMAFSGHLAEEYVPPLYHYALTFLWRVFDGDLSIIYALRGLNFLLFCTQAILVFQMFFHVFSELKGKWFFIAFAVLATSFVTLLSAFRGYEIRPEGLGNTFMLLGIFWLFLNWKINTALRYAFYLVVCICLVIAASLSFRLLLPSFFIWIAAAVQMLQNNEVAQLRGIRSLSYAIALSAVVLVIINYLFVDWEYVLGRLQLYSAGDGHMDWKNRFTVNAWTGYGVFCLVILGLIVGLAAYSVALSKAASSVRLVNVFLFFALLSFYIFLFAWDVNPRGYIHSIEWILILALTLFSIRTAKFSRRALLFTFTFVVGALLFLAGRAANDLSVDRDTTYFLGGIFNALSQEEMARQDDALLVRYFGYTSSLADQINSRREFCTRHRGSFVISGNITYHPICLVDMGTYDFSGWGKNSVDFPEVPPDRSLFVLAAPAEKVVPLIYSYGDRYKTMADIPIVGGGVSGEIQRR